ncbi:dipeptide transport system ATP-binding protein [Chitinasiproducens palmae]|uniref:Dipeptide transport system ATP-binding protein n=1 Tax=Chitinasiproducens palmae TaxID=1770053 RepID=A0A1H2PT93_9BURK|nr:dipeptide transport system ATP-binding protein [Chitinasiproducens palmae]
MSALLDIDGLSVDFDGFPACHDVRLHVAAGETLGIVGESGSGKSVAMLATMGLVDAPGRVTATRIDFDGRNLLALPARERRRIVGRDIAMVFQDAQSSLNPSYTVGAQIGEVLGTHLGLRGAARRRRVVELLEQVEIPDAARRQHAFPHQLSGGMNQRVMIAMAIACEPRLLIADEPTTALDVTIQAQILALLRRLQRERGMALILISHDLAVVAETADRVAVMYAGEVVEHNAVPTLFDAPHHPYTAALLAAIPARSHGNARLAALPGVVPGRDDRPPGCLFEPRCAHAVAACRAARPALLAPPVQRRLPSDSPAGLATASTPAPTAGRGAPDDRVGQAACAVVTVAQARDRTYGEAPSSRALTMLAERAQGALVRCIKPLNLDVADANDHDLHAASVVAARPGAAADELPGDFR